MIQNNGCEDIIELSNFLKIVQIARDYQVDKFLEKRGLSAKRIDSVKRSALAQRMCATLLDGKYFVVHEGVSISAFTPKLQACIDVYLDYYPEVNFFQLYCQFPASAFFIGVKNGDGMGNDCTLFYVKQGEETATSRYIETVYGIYNEPVNIMIIVENVEQIHDIKLSDKFNILSFITDIDGQLNYYNSEDEV